MPIIYIKNPRSGSHFRHIGGSKGGRPMRGIQKTFKTDRRGIRSVGWASCSGPTDAKWASYSPGGNPFKQAGSFTNKIAGAIWALVGLTESTAANNTTDSFSRPCR